MPAGVATLDRRGDPLGHDGRLEMGGGAGLRERQVRRVAERVDVVVAGDLERVPVGRQPATGRRREPGIDQELLALVRRHEDEQVVAELLAFEAQDDLALRVDGLDVEEGVELDVLGLEDRGGHLATRSRW